MLNSSQKNRLVWVSGLIIVALVVVLLLPAPSGVRPQGRLNGCTNNMRNIALAVAAYAEDHGHLPPPYLTDEDGTPTHSWRVLILPYIEEKDLYDDYDFRQPWNSEHNLALPMPNAFECPSDAHDPSDTHTGYVAVVGDNTAWPNNGKRLLSDISDSDILILETFDARRHWLDPACPMIQEFVNGRIGLRSDHERGVVVASFRNGGYQYLRFDHDVTQLIDALNTDSKMQHPVNAPPTSGTEPRDERES